MIDINIASQTKLLLFALGLGFIIGIIYDIFRIIRLSISRGRAAVFVQDILFFIIFSAVTFVFCLTLNNGKIRLFIVLSEILGFLIYYISFGAFVIRVSGKIIYYIKKFFTLMAKVISAPILFFHRIILKIFKKISKIIVKRGKKTGKKLKYLLQRNTILLYNVHNKLSLKRKKQSGVRLDEDF